MFCLCMSIIIGTFSWMEHVYVNEYKHKQNMFKQDLVREVHIYLFDTIEYIFGDLRALLISQTINQGITTTFVFVMYSVDTPVPVRKM